MPFQSEKQKKWMWANKPEMAREWTQEYGSKVKAKTGTMTKKDDKWIQKATKNMRKDKPCTGKKFGSPTCPKGTRRYSLAKTFKKMNKPKKAFLGKMFRKSSTATPTSGSSSGGGSSGMGGLLRRLFEEKKHLFGKAGGGPAKAVLGLYAMSKMSDKKKDKVKSHFKKRASLLSPVASQFFNKGGPTKAKHGKYIPIPTPHADIAKYLTKSGVIEGPKGEDTFWRKKDSTMKNKIARDLGKSIGRKAGPKRSKPQIKIWQPKDGISKELIIIGKTPLEKGGGQSFTPGWKPQLSVRTAREGKIFDSKKVSSKTHERFMKLFKHRETGGWKEATKYKKYLKSLKKMQKTPLAGTSTTLPPKTARLLSQLKFAYKDRGKASTATKIAHSLGKSAAAPTFLKRRMTLSGAGSLPGTLPRATALKVAKALGKRTGLGKAVLAATAVAGAYEAGKRKLFTKDKKKVQKKSTGGEIIIGRGVDMDLL